jgi:hypothetical protein
MITLLTPRFTPFFLITWIISNVSVAIYPLQALPHVYRYGYAFPFYNISRAVRTIVFRTKNEGAFLSASLPPCVSLLIIQIVIRF